MTPVAHSLEGTDPDYQRGHMAARVAVRDCPNPAALWQLRRVAALGVVQADDAACRAASQQRYWRGYQTHLTDLENAHEHPE